MYIFIRITYGLRRINWENKEKKYADSDIARTKVARLHRPLFALRNMVLA